MKVAVFSCFLLFSIFSPAQESTREPLAPATLETQATDDELVQTPLGAASPARILGNIPDGTPPPPTPPKPPFVVAPRNILSATTHQQGGRTITVREIQPITLPPPPAPPPPPVPLTPEQLERINSYQETHPKNEILFLGATVFRPKDSPPRTLVRYWQMTEKKEISFWSSADFALIAGGLCSFVDSAGDSHSIFMSWGNVELETLSDLHGPRGKMYGPPPIPEFPAGSATWKINGDPPADPAELVPIQSLHDLYNREHDRLLTAYQGRERARKQHEADLKANPPKPKNITLNYWRTETPAAPVKGGAK